MSFCIVGILVSSYGFPRGVPGFVPGPTLLYPTSEHIKLSGKDDLEFRWERTDLIETDHFIFKLYKGYNMSEPGMVVRIDFGVDTYPIKVSVQKLEINQVYTWSLQQVLLGGLKSDRSFSTFKITEK